MTISKTEPAECLKLLDSLCHADNGVDMQRSRETPAHWARVHHKYVIVCQCCNGSGRHDSGHLNVQDAHDYPCQPCRESGEFKIEVPTP